MAWENDFMLELSGCSGRGESVSAILCLLHDIAILEPRIRESRWTLDWTEAIICATAAKGFLCVGLDLLCGFS